MFLGAKERFVIFWNFASSLSPEEKTTTFGSESEANALNFYS